MIAGSANVRLNDDFARVIDRVDSYYVFLTPLGDTRGLYVSQKRLPVFRYERRRGAVRASASITALPIRATLGTTASRGGM